MHRVNRVLGALTLIVAVSGTLAAPARAQLDPDLADNAAAATVLLSALITQTENGATKELTQCFLGSGSVVSPDGRFILTNSHVVSLFDAAVSYADTTEADLVATSPGRQVDVQAKEIIVSVVDYVDALPDRRYRAEVVKQDEAVDLALLRITGDSPGRNHERPLHRPYFTLNFEAASTGQAVTLFGYPAPTSPPAEGSVDPACAPLPEFQSIRLFPGTISGSSGPNLDHLEVTATASRGMSGGSAVNAAGQLIGIPYRVQQMDAGNVVEVIPIESARAMVEEFVPSPPAATETTSPPTDTPVPTPTLIPTAPPSSRQPAMEGGNAALNQVQPGPGPEGSPQLRWRFPLARGSSSPAVQDGIVYVGSGRGTSGDPEGPSYLYAIDAETGDEVWRFGTAAATYSSPTLAGDVVYISDFQATLYAIDAATGEERWRFTDPEFTGGYILEVPFALATVLNDTVYISQASGTLYALDASTGQERWRFSQRITTPPAVSGSTVYVGSVENSIHALDASTGAELWRFTTDGPVTAAPTVYRGTTFVCDWRGNLYALQRESGNKVWSLPMGGSDCSLATANGVIYAGDRDGVVHAIDLMTRSEIWRFETGTDFMYPRPVVAAGVVYVTGVNGTLYAIDGSSGAEIWRFEIGDEVYDWPAVIDGVVYVTSSDSLYAIGG